MAFGTKPSAWTNIISSFSALSSGNLVGKMCRAGDFRNAVLILSLALCVATGCSAKKKATAPTPAPIRSEIPPPTAETVEHCVVIKQENENTVTCSCQALSTKIDAKTGHTTLVCKATQEQSQ